MIKIFILMVLMMFSGFANPTHHVGVFCATDEQVPDLYKTQAYELGVALSQAALGLVTGGGNSGLMNAVVNGFTSQEETENLRGIIPAIFKTYNVHHPKIPVANLIWTDNIHQRLQGFHDQCDTMVILPGGFGTLHELMDFIVPKQWGLNQKKIILFNMDNYWDNQLLQFKVMVEKKALKQKHLDLLSVVTTVDECIQLIQAEGTSIHQGLNDRYWEENSPHK